MGAIIWHDLTLKKLKNALKNAEVAAKVAEKSLEVNTRREQREREAAAAARKRESMKLAGVREAERAADAAAGAPSTRAGGCGAPQLARSSSKDFYNVERVIMCILALSFSHASAHNESKKAQSTRAPPCLLCLVYSLTGQ